MLHHTFPKGMAITSYLDDETRPSYGTNKKHSIYWRHEESYLAL